MATEDESSELSSLSSLSDAPSEDDGDIEVKQEAGGIMKFFHKLPAGKKAEEKKEASPPPRKRSPSPAHEYVLADNPSIAVRDDFLFRVKKTRNVASFPPLANLT